ncbi:MAG: response regulator [Chloroflexi bacterium]|nr:response regulator [Chloroflexota bacterium]
MSLSDVHALIIEDDPSSVDVLQNLLEQLTVSTTVLMANANLTDELQTIARPDVIFLDLEMPWANGYEILNLLHSDTEFEGVPVVAYTTHISHMNNARQAGFHSFLGKPIHRYHFPDNLRRILNGEQVWEAP